MLEFQGFLLSLRTCFSQLSTLLTQLIYAHLSNLQIIIGEWKRVYKLKCTSKSAVMKSYQCVPSAILFAYKWHNLLTLFGLYLEGVNISLSALSRCRDTRKQDANWREGSIFTWRLTFNYVWGDQIRWWPQKCLKTTFCRAATLEAAEDVIWIAVWGSCWMAALWMESLCYDLRVIGCPQWSVDKRGGESDRNNNKTDRQ